MSLLVPSKVMNTKSLAGTEPADADVATWKDDHFGIGIGTDGSAWFLYKHGSVVKYVALAGVPA